MTTPIVVKIDSMGITGPPFDQVLAYLQQQWYSIQGIDIVLDPSTQDAQLLAIFADALNDMNSSAIAAFNNFIPSFAFGAGLSSIVKINGIARQVASSSRVTLTLGGTEGTIITNVTVGDNLNLGTQWFVIGPVTIPPAGVVDVLAACTSLGATTAAPGTLTQILTPIPGWQTATNVAAATPGAPVETDAQLRRRQTQSTALPASTVLSSIQGNLLNLAGVTRAKVFQNDTVITDPTTGIPGRSIACVVEGGDPTQIATTIALTKAPGVPTYGDTSVTVYDSVGTPNLISYWQLTPIEISVLIWLVASVGYTSQVATYIQQALAEYFNSLDIGQLIYIGDAYSPANLDGDAAVIGTGLLQVQLDPLSATYHIGLPHTPPMVGLALYRPGMEATGGPYPAGATVISVTNTTFNYHVPEALWLTLDNGTFFQATTTAVGTQSITIDTPVPSERSVLAGAKIYGVRGIVINFNEAATVANLSDIIINAQ
jgi:uncharacterized phage protein gp47/JayE